MKALAFPIWPIEADDRGNNAAIIHVDRQSLLSFAARALLPEPQSPLDQGSNFSQIDINSSRSYQYPAPKTSVIFSSYASCFREGDDLLKEDGFLVTTLGTLSVGGIQ